MATTPEIKEVKEEKKFSSMEICSIKGYSGMTSFVINKMCKDLSLTQAEWETKIKELNLF